ncbi:uncharacterized protein LOC34618768 [Cyclospora cayetanensis]|uniref:Uncharacterized protein LOC34618768 n=1 Tax=Cyclospora cayetanensis TaxID=88456 RepID=A0A6P6S087_9EIME|nr:uncharacterized protein LOC34618768 [Cyclospora cayetanensis]
MCACASACSSSSAGLALAPPLRYSAPELSSAFPPRASEAADVFSFSLLAAEILGARGLPTCKDGELQDHQQQAPEIQQAALTAVQTSHGVFDYTAHRTLFLPRVLSLIANAESSAVRLAGLEALRSMGSSFDRDTVEAQILPVLLQVDEDRQRHFAVKAEQQSAVDAALPSSQETPSLPAVSLEGLLATASLPVPPSLSLPSGKGGLLHSLPTPPKPPPPPPASTCLTPQYASNSTSGLHRQHQGALSEAAEQMLPSLNARLPEHKFPAPRGNTSGAEKNSPSRASEECSELDMILAAASAAIPQNKPS